MICDLRFTILSAGANLKSTGFNLTGEAAGRAEAAAKAGNLIAFVRASA